MLIDLSERLKRIEQEISAGDVSDAIVIRLENGKCERWMDIDLLLSLFNFPDDGEIMVVSQMVGKTELSEDNMVIAYHYEKKRRSLAPYQQWLVSWLELMKEQAEKRQKGQNDNGKQR